MQSMRVSGRMMEHESARFVTRRRASCAMSTDDLIATDRDALTYVLRRCRPADENSRYDADIEQEDGTHVE